MLFELLKYYFLIDEEYEGQFDAIRQRIKAELLIMELEEHEQGRNG